MKKYYLAIIASFLAGSLLYGADESYRNLDKRICPILDTPYRTLSGLEMIYEFSSKTDASGWGKLSVYDINAWVRLVEWENKSGGDLEIQAQINSLFLETSATSESFSLMRADFFLQWSQRFINGYGLQLHASPGLYSSLQKVTGNDISIPFGITGIKAFSPGSAFFAGIRVYPDINDPVEPIAGFRWAHRDDFVAQLAYPESRLEFSPAESIRFIIGASMWVLPDYNMGNDDRERIQIEESRVFGAIEFTVSEYTIFSLKGGYLFDREVSFKASIDEVEVEDAPFAGIAFSGRW